MQEPEIARWTLIRDTLIFQFKHHSCLFLLFFKPIINNDLSVYGKRLKPYKIHVKIAWLVLTHEQSTM